MVLLIAFAAVAAQQAQPADKAAQQKPKDPVICKLETEASSRIPNRICHLQSEWDAMERVAQDDFRRQQRNTGINQQPH